MDIKRTGPGIPAFEPSRTGEVNKPDKSFAAPQAGPTSQPSAAPTPGLESVTSRFSKADLNDPAKLETMVRSSVDELINAQFGGQPPLTEAQKAQIGDFMSSDPLIRRQIERYLERVLK
ncbi:MAG: hypothetical protein ACRD8O_08510 [Bryobacteraceae bacterium]